MSKTLPNFVHIGPRTSLYTPEEPAVGELVVICTWLGAAPKHIAKYAAMYQRIAPGARILLIESNVPILVSSYARQHRHIEAAARAVVDVLAESDDGVSDVARKEAGGRLSTPKILLHTFSNGGTNTATQLLIVLRQKRARPLPLVGIIFDSCPAVGTYWKSHSAMVLSLPPNPMTQIVGTIAVHVLLCMLYTWIACGNENPASLQRRTMLASDTIVAPGAAARQSGVAEKDGARVQDVEIGEADAEEVSRSQAKYIYSKSDRMCYWEDVREHAEDARQLGWGVEEIVYEGTAHCAHYSKDASRYEGAVERLWSSKPRREKSGGDGGSVTYAVAKL